jgi:hypothetical protein
MSHQHCPASFSFFEIRSIYIFLAGLDLAM